MPKSKPDLNTRQLFASIEEGLYLSAKSRAAELRIPMRVFIERALELALELDNTPSNHGNHDKHPIWKDEYLKIQSQQPIGSPVELTSDEATSIISATFDLK